MAAFPGKPGLAGFIGAKDDGSKAPVKRHHQQTNTQLFTGQMPFLPPNQQCRSTELLTILTVNNKMSPRTTYLDKFKYVVKVTADVKFYNSHDHTKLLK